MRSRASLRGASGIACAFIVAGALFIGASSSRAQTVLVTDTVVKTADDKKKTVAQAERKGSAVRGERIFKLCAPCHDVGPGAQHKWGPHLNGIIGSPVGNREGYPSSIMLVYFGMLGEVWTEELLADYIASPAGFMSEEYAVQQGSTSPFVGLSDEQKRADIIAFIKVASSLD